MSNGSLQNNTGEYLLVYGPKRVDAPTDNSLYLLPPGRQTPGRWDCDGFFVPADRIAKQLVLADRPGPVAVKYVDFQSPAITLVEANKYYCPGNRAIIAPGELNWPIPTINYDRIQEDFPEVPGHTPIA